MNTHVYVILKLFKSKCVCVCVKADISLLFGSQIPEAVGSACGPSVLHCSSSSRFSTPQQLHLAVGYFYQAGSLADVSFGTGVTTPLPAHPPSPIMPCRQWEGAGPGDVTAV